MVKIGQWSVFLFFFFCIKFHTVNSESHLDVCIAPNISIIFSHFNYFKAILSTLLAKLKTRKREKKTNRQINSMKLFLPKETFSIMYRFDFISSIHFPTVFFFLFYFTQFATFCLQRKSLIYRFRCNLCRTLYIFFFIRFLAFVSPSLFE